MSHRCVYKIGARSHQSNLKNQDGINWYEKFWEVYADINGKSAFTPSHNDAEEPLPNVAIKNVKKGGLEVIRNLLKNGADVNIQKTICRRYSRMINSPLHDAIGENNLEVVKLLLEHGADINIVDHDNHTALYFAIHKGYAQIAQLLTTQQLINYCTTATNWIRSTISFSFARAQNVPVVEEKPSSIVTNTRKK